MSDDKVSLSVRDFIYQVIHAERMERAGTIDAELSERIQLVAFLDSVAKVKAAMKENEDK